MSSRRLGALTELYKGDDLIESSLKPNMFGQVIDRVKYGIVSVNAASQGPISLYFDRVTASTFRFRTLSTTGIVGGTDSTLCPLAYLSLADGEWPHACWRPYADTSPFNTPIPANPRLVANSSQIVERYSGGPIDVPVDGTGWSHPIYFSQASDADFRAYCTGAGSACPSTAPTGQLTSWSFNLDPRSKPTDYRSCTLNSGEVTKYADCHLTVFDEERGIEVSFWQAYVDTQNHVVYGNGVSKETLPGDGIEPDVTAAHFTGAAGMIRGEELAAGEINHALVVTISCDSGTYVYPATGRGAACGDRTNAAAEGQLFQLDPSYDISGYPAWKQAVLRAAQRYGIYVVDTGGSPTDIMFEEPISHTSLGYPNPFTQVQSSGAFDLASGGWWSRLRVVDPCVPQGTC
jgi:hypothetical protein